VSPSNQASDFVQLARRLQNEPGMDQTLERIVAVAAETVHCDGAGIFLLHGRHRVESAAATDPSVEQADELQLVCGQGPCLEAIEDHEIVIIQDTLTDLRWREWSALAAGLGWRSVLSLRLFTTKDTIGSLNLYSVHPAKFDGDDAGVASIFAGHASMALAAARSEASLRQAMDARHVIGQAQGILMERFTLSADQAFAVLRRYSQDHNVKLRQVADEVVATRTLPS